jgi:cytochrome c peroxidase
VPIRFVTAGGKTQAAWDKLKTFWTDVRIPPSPLGKGRREIRIKVPLGLADPTGYVPASNPATLGKWQLGKQLFFDDTWLYSRAAGKGSCASCHRPDHGFTTGKGPTRGLRVSTLINCVYNRNQFWDGRTTALEQVVQRSQNDEREPETSGAGQQRLEAERRHAWSGVIGRLRANATYKKGFRKVFGTPATQDNLGKALATYLRTLLAGGSLYDRARAAAGDREPEDKHYRALLSDSSLKALRREDSKKADVAKELVQGSNLFHNQGRCALCHKGFNFTDNSFHNIGLSSSEPDPDNPSGLGRFAVLPTGLKDRRLVGAYKTPTLRVLKQTGVYFHDGLAAHEDALAQAVIRHTKGNAAGVFLDPLLADPADRSKRRDLKITGDQLHALLLFLRALDSKADAVVKPEPKE